MLLTKLRTFAPSTCQIVCISATIGGVDPVLDWLDAIFFCTNYRPVKLQEHVVFGPHVYGLDMPPATGSAAANPTAGPGAKFQHPSTAKTDGLAANVKSDVIKAVKDANLTPQRELDIQTAPKQQFASQVAVKLALEVVDVRCCLWLTCLLLSLAGCLSHCEKICPVRKFAEAQLSRFEYRSQTALCAGRDFSWWGCCAIRMIVNAFRISALCGLIFVLLHMVCYVWSI